MSPTIVTEQRCIKVNGAPDYNLSNSQIIDGALAPKLLLMIDASAATLTPEMICLSLKLL